MDRIREIIRYLIKENIEEENAEIKINSKSQPNPYEKDGYPEIIYVFATIEGMVIGKLMLYKIDTNREPKRRNITIKDFQYYLEIGDINVSGYHKRKGIYTKILLYALKNFKLPIVSPAERRSGEADLFWKNFMTKTNVKKVKGNFIVYP